MIKTNAENYRTSVKFKCENLTTTPPPPTTFSGAIKNFEGRENVKPEKKIYRKMITQNFEWQNKIAKIKFLKMQIGQK